MTPSECYSLEYFDSIRGLSRTSAEIVAPLVMELLQPRSVVDVGCGTGAWAAAFKSQGVGDVLGIDGDYCDRSQLEIDGSEFLAADLTQPMALNRSFDLATCLEVAEHLDERFANQLVTTLARLAPAVLFSAAIPYQGGEHHVNEQWPSYWVGQFAKQKFVAADPFRRRLWQNDSVAWWYAQNLLLFLRREAIESWPRLQELDFETPSTIPLLVHPQCLLQAAWRIQVLEAAIELINITQEGAHILLVDEARFGKLPPLGRDIEPFTEHRGVYGGPPADSKAAIEELEQKRAAGAEAIAFGWPAFWWLEHYDDFAKYLRENFHETLRNNRWIVWRLTRS